MQYDIAAKQLLKWSKEALLERFLGIRADSVEEEQLDCLCIV